MVYITSIGNKILNSNLLIYWWFIRDQYPRNFSKYKLWLCVQEEEILKVSKNSGDSAQQLVYLNEQIQAKNR